MRITLRFIAILGAFWQLAIASSAMAQDTIVFIDTNDAWGEYLATQRAAAARNPKARVVLIPPISQQDIAERNRLERLMNPLRDQRDRFRKTDPKRSEVERKIRDLERQAVYLRLPPSQRPAPGEPFPDKSPPPAINTAILQRELAKLKTTDARLTSVIISGHQENTRHFGTLGDLSTKRIGEAFQRIAPKNSTVLSLFVPGCYTCVAGALGYNWKQGFPGAMVLGGYYDKAPLGHRPVGHQYLEGFLKVDRELAEAKTIAEMEAAVRKIPKNGMTTSICTDRYHAQGNSVKATADAKKQCEALANNNTLQKWQEIIDCYDRGDPKCSDPSPNCPSTESSATRELHNNLRCVYQQANMHKVACEGFFKSREQSFPDTLYLARMANYRFVQYSFAKMNSDETNRLLRNLGDLNPNINWSADPLLKGSRSDQVNFLAKADSALQKATEIRKDPKRLNNLFRAQVAQGRFKEGEFDRFRASLSRSINLARQSLMNHRRILVNLDSDCIPSDWLTTHARGGSPCLRGGNGHRYESGSRNLSPLVPQFVVSHWLQRLNLAISAAITTAVSSDSDVTSYLISLDGVAERIGASPLKIAASSDVPWTADQLREIASANNLQSMDLAGLVQLAYEALYVDPTESEVCGFYPGTACDHIMSYMRTLRSEAPDRATPPANEFQDVAD